MSRSTLQIKRQPNASLSWLITNAICVLDPHLRIRKRQLSDYYDSRSTSWALHITARTLILGTPNLKACKKLDMTHTCL